MRSVLKPDRAAIQLKTNMASTSSKALFQKSARPMRPSVLVNRRSNLTAVSFKHNRLNSVDPRAA
jgi:hypothetical protein